MSRRSQKESDDVEKVATVAVGTAVGAVAAYGCYKLCQSMFDSNRPQRTEQPSVNSRNRDSPSSFGATVSNVIDSMQLAYNGMRLYETISEALPQEQPQRAQTTHSAHSPFLYPDLNPNRNPSRHVNLSTNNVNNPSGSRPSVSGADVVETMQALYSGYKLCQSLFGSDSSQSNSNVATCAHRQPIFRAVVVETQQKAQEALKTLKKYVDF